MTMKKRLLILGSTGSIGTQTLEVVKHHRDRFEMVGLSAHKNSALLKKQQGEWGLTATQINLGEIHETFIKHSGADTVVIAIHGSAGLRPTLAAIRAGKEVALANKEALVMAGETVMKEAKAHGVKVIPIDSEHSALYALLKKVDRNEVKKIILTCSGGPFWKNSQKILEHVTREEALKHPTWTMGSKITIDSATWMNKGFEIIEAHHLFGFEYDQIEVLIHPQSIVHAIIEMRDGTRWVHASSPDMRIPIEAALLNTEASESATARVHFGREIKIVRLKQGESLEAVGSLFNQALQFEPPDVKGPLQGIRWGYWAGRQGQEACRRLVEANEKAVKRFLAGEIGFLEIYGFIDQALSDFKSTPS